MTDFSSDLQIREKVPGRAQYIDPQGRLYISRLYDIFRSDDGGAVWQPDCSIPITGYKSALARFSLAARLLRYYVANFQIMDDGTRIAVARDGIYRADPGESQLSLSFRIKRGSRPMNICVDGHRVIFGEYGDCFKNLEAYIYVSEDRGRTFDVAYTFPRGNIRHVHNVIADPYKDHYWILVGDYDTQPGIGVLSKDLKSIDWLLRGVPESRVVGAIIKPDSLLFGTDSDNGPNFIIRMDRQTGKLSKLLEVEGSSLYAASFGPVMAISTCVEPNPTCPSNECSLYFSRDGDAWKRVMPHQKDRHHPFFFQYGTLVLPIARNNQAIGMFSGQAVVGAHNLVTMLNFNGKE
jgi:hypothetical protein